MIFEFSLNPNCSETVYRFRKVDTSKLPGGIKFINKIMKKGGSFRPIEEVSGDGYSYSNLRPGSDADICIYFYQTDCEELESALIKAKINYIAEKPFGSNIKTKRKNLFKLR